ncbi:MAG: hypothetical protein Q7R56_00580 [Nanoarchaeota archaeon]|nr:hypothetical protein [Nanoarchaeota archaeon]
MTRFTPNGLLVLEEAVALEFLFDLQSKHVNDPSNEPLRTIRNVLFPEIERENNFYYRIAVCSWNVYREIFSSKIASGFLDSVTVFYHLLKAQGKKDGIHLPVLTEDSPIPDNYPVDVHAIREKTDEVMIKMSGENTVLFSFIPHAVLGQVHHPELVEQTKSFIAYSYWMFSEVAKEAMIARRRGESPN